MRIVRSSYILHPDSYNAASNALSRGLSATEIIFLTSSSVTSSSGSLVLHCFVFSLIHRTSSGGSSPPRNHLKNFRKATLKVYFVHSELSDCSRFMLNVSIKSLVYARYS